jgi:hypothetical protein
MFLFGFENQKKQLHLSIVETKKAMTTHNNPHALSKISKLFVIYWAYSFAAECHRKVKQESRLNQL